MQLSLIMCSDQSNSLVRSLSQSGFDPCILVANSPDPSASCRRQRSDRQGVKTGEQNRRSEPPPLVPGPEPGTNGSDDPQHTTRGQGLRNCPPPPPGRGMQKMWQKIRPDLRAVPRLPVEWSVASKSAGHCPGLRAIKSPPALVWAR